MFDGGIRIGAAAQAPNGEPLKGAAGWAVEAPEDTTIQIPYVAEDKGSGVALAQLSLDFTAQGGSKGTVASDTDENGGICKEVAGGGYVSTVPCKLKVEGRSFSVDTTQIPDGTHTLTPVVADAGGGNVVFGEPIQITVHNAGSHEEHEERHGSAPQTKISKHPRAKTALRVARFAFSSDQAGSTFQCKLDKAPFKSCRSPFKHKMKRGRHVFQVRAVNFAGAVDSTPAAFRWKVS